MAGSRGMVGRLKQQAIEARRKRVFRVVTRDGEELFYSSIGMTRALAQHRRAFRESADPFAKLPKSCEEIAALSNSTTPH